jgi:hypothetical protein
MKKAVKIFRIKLKIIQIRYKKNIIVLLRKKIIFKCYHQITNFKLKSSRIKNILHILSIDNLRTKTSLKLKESVSTNYIKSVK